MEPNPYAAEYTPEDLADHMQHAFSDLESRSMSPSHVAFHEQAGITAEETASLYQDAMRYQRCPTSPPEELNQVVPSGNRHHRHHHRHGATSIPLDDIAHHCCRHPHNHKHSSRDSAEECKRKRQIERKKRAGEVEIKQQQAHHQATEDQDIQLGRDTRRMTTSSSIDTHCFYRKAQREFYAGYTNKNFFYPKACSFLIFQHAEKTATVDSCIGTAYGPELIELMGRPRSAGYQCELRIIMSPENKDLEKPDSPYMKTNVTTPFPFDAATCETLFEACEFHKGFFEMSNSGHSHGIQNARVNSYTQGGTHSFFIGLGDTGNRNMKVFVSYNDYSRVTTVFIHDCSASEKHHLQDRLMDTAMQPLTLHPILIPVMILERLLQIMWQDVKQVYHEAMDQVSKAGIGRDIIPNTDAREQSARSLRISQNGYAHQWKMGQLREFIKNMKDWSRDIDEKDPRRESSFRTVRDVLYDRLLYLEGSLEEAQLQITATIHYVSIYRHWLDVHIANSANNLNLAISKSAYSMALESRKDQSAVKAISVMSMVFLPGSFFCGIFNLPFFNWEAKDMKDVIMTHRIWIYVFCALGSTLFVMIFWRFWFRFEKWRLSHGRGKDIRRDLGLWFRSGCKQTDHKAQENREIAGKQVLHQTVAEV